MKFLVLKDKVVVRYNGEELTFKRVKGDILAVYLPLWFVKKAFETLNFKVIGARDKVVYWCPVEPKYSRITIFEDERKKTQNTRFYTYIRDLKDILGVMKKRGVSFES